MMDLFGSLMSLGAGNSGKPSPQPTGGFQAVMKPPPSQANAKGLFEAKMPLPAPTELGTMNQSVQATLAGAPTSVNTPVATPGTDWGQVGLMALQMAANSRGGSQPQQGLMPQRFNGGGQEHKFVNSKEFSQAKMSG